ncbi:MAG: DMT family transporter [Planctomycetia bacterium]|nr:DMT family transporter [Planctomycetia bacterium]
MVEFNISSATKKKGFSWAWVLPLLSAFFYTVSNSCMRQLADMNTDIHLAVALRESVAFYFAVPLFLWMFCSGKIQKVAWRTVIIFLFISVCVQCVGNVSLQYAFRILGLAVSVAGNWVGLLLCMPVLAYGMLGEKLSRRLILSLVVIFVAMIFLTVGTKQRESYGGKYSSQKTFSSERESCGKVVSETEDFKKQERETGEISESLAVRVFLLVFIVGGINAASYTYIRFMEKSGVSPLLPVILLPGTGYVVLSLYDFFQNGFTTYAAFSGMEYFWIYSSGFANLLAFIFLTLGLKYLSAVKVSILNISQLLLAPIAGYLIFCERINGSILVGMVLMILGILAANVQKQDEVYDVR